ncbi:MAG: DUF4837 family protein [Paludibacteraceae bacterium]|nr:DUF4837 family protein [Paludibacteraceae bacterium]
MKRILVYTACALAVMLTSCGKNGGRTLTSATGSIYECLVVMPDRPLSQEVLRDIHLSIAKGSAYEEAVATTYDLVKAVMAADMPCMPQMEPYFTLSQVPTAAFDDYLKPTRNILFVDIDPNKYTQTKAKVSVNVWSKPQAVYRIQAPSDEAFAAYWLVHGEEVRDWFVRQELKRQTTFYRGSTNQDARAALQKTIGCDMWVPEDYMLIMDTVISESRSVSGGQEDFSTPVRLVWCCNNKGPMRRDLVVYAYDYTSEQMFTSDWLNGMRDKVLGQVVTASVEGSYMGTEYRVFPPQSRVVPSLENQQDEGFYATEVRGLWKIKNGEAMGGPYVSLTRLDQANGRVVTAETFIFAAGQKKRNALRQSEAILYTLKMSYEKDASKQP